jgi:hypothetical protein
MMTRQGKLVGFIYQEDAIRIKGAWLEKYKKSYDEYHSKT